MAGENFRIERDSMGEVKVPSEAYYGAQTQRAVENFPVSGIGFPRQFIRALATVKYAAASANEELGLLDPRLAGAIRQAADEVMEGKLDDQFVVDIFQTGSGTSTNMNANEVIANRALKILAKPRSSKEIHPNDHVNLCQSSNDVIPTAMHCAALWITERELLPALARLHAALSRKVAEFDDVIKIGRTHLADATPIRLGQEFSGYARQIELSIERIKSAAAGLAELPLGGTAIGTGINAASGIRRASNRQDFSAARLAISRSRQSLRSPSGAGCCRAHERQLEIARRQLDKNCQRFALARLRTALRHRRDSSSGHSTRIVDHAGESEPGVVQVGAASGGACDRLRRHNHVLRPSRQLRAQRDDAGDGAAADRIDPIHR
jgi:aspartate ammonia-lyase